MCEWIAHEAGVNYEHAKAAAERKVHNGVKGELAEIRSTLGAELDQNALEIDSPTWVDGHVVFQGDRWTYRDEESGDAIDTLVAKDRTTNDCKDVRHTLVISTKAPIASTSIGCRAREASLSTMTGRVLRPPRLSLGPLLAWCATHHRRRRPPVTSMVTVLKNHSATSHRVASSWWVTSQSLSSVKHLA